MTDAKPIGHLNFIPADLPEKCPKCDHPLTYLDSLQQPIMIPDNGYIKDGKVYCHNNHEVMNAIRKPIYKLRDL